MVLVMHWEKKMKPLSLRLKLTLFISGFLFIACSITMVTTYVELKNSLRELFDSQQLLFAKRLSVLNLDRHEMGPNGFQHRPLPNIKADELNYDDDALAFAIFSTRGDMLLSDGKNGKKLAFDGGFFSYYKGLALISESEKWRILWLLSHDRQSIIAVGQKKDYQQDILEKLLYKQLIPWSVTFVVVILLIILVIRREFLVIRQLTGQLFKREPDDASPINPEKSPKEIQPFLIALNNLFQRISSMISRERQFISDAAHELRTPLAALKVQTEVAQLSDDDPVSQQKALKNLNIGIDRAAHLVDQLLTLSRLDSMQIQNEREQIHWPQLIGSVIDELQLLAEQKKIPISVSEKVEKTTVNAHPVLMRILIRNLINNAIRYTPQHSKINIIIDEQSVIVTDNGHGVDSETLVRLGERFYRPAGQSQEGSGLGLSIVKKIVQLHDMSVSYENRSEEGFQVRLNY